MIWNFSMYLRIIGSVKHLQKDDFTSLLIQCCLRFYSLSSMSFILVFIADYAVTSIIFIFLESCSTSLLISSFFFSLQPSLFYTIFKLLIQLLIAGNQVYNLEERLSYLSLTKCISSPISRIVFSIVFRRLCKCSSVCLSDWNLVKDYYNYDIFQATELFIENAELSSIWFSFYQILLFSA